MLSSRILICANPSKSALIRVLLIGAPNANQPRHDARRLGVYPIADVARIGLAGRGDRVAAAIGIIGVVFETDDAGSGSPLRVELQIVECAIDSTELDRGSAIETCAPNHHQCCERGAQIENKVRSSHAKTVGGDSEKGLPLPSVYRIPISARFQ